MHSMHEAEQSYQGLGLATGMQETRNNTLCYMMQTHLHASNVHSCLRRPIAACTPFHAAIHVLAALAEQRTPWLAMTHTELAAPLFCRNIVSYIALCKLTAQLPGLKPSQNGRWALIEEFLKVRCTGLTSMVP